MARRAEGRRPRPLPSPRWPGSSRAAPAPPPAVGRGPRPASLRDRPPSLAGAARSNQLKSRIDGCLASGGRPGCPSGAAAGRASWKRLGRGPSGGSCRLGRLPPSPRRPLGLPSSRWREAPTGCCALRAPGKRRLCLAGDSGPACWVTLSRRPTSSGKVSGPGLGSAPSRRSHRGFRCAAALPQPRSGLRGVLPAWLPRPGPLWVRRRSRAQLRPGLARPESSCQGPCRPPAAAPPSIIRADLFHYNLIPSSAPARRMGPGSERGGSAGLVNLCSRCRRRRLPCTLAHPPAQEHLRPRPSAGLSWGSRRLVLRSPSNVACVGGGGREFW